MIEASGELRQRDIPSRRDLLISNEFEVTFHEMRCDVAIAA